MQVNQRDARRRAPVLWRLRTSLQIDDTRSVPQGLFGKTPDLVLVDEIVEELREVAMRELIETARSEVTFEVTRSDPQE